MEEAEQRDYVSQLKAEFDSCDTTATGFLDRDELMALCRKLQLDAHLPLLLDTLLGPRTYGRVNFEEFKDGFVAILSRSLDFSTSEDDSSYLEPVVPDEVKPKFVKGTKRYGRRSRPDKPDAALTRDSEDSLPSRTEATDSSPAGVRRAKLRRSTSLESVESLKSDEDAGSQKENVGPDFQCKGPQQEEVELRVGEGAGGDVLTTVCDHLSLQQLNTARRLFPPHATGQTDRELLRKLDARLSIRDFHKALRGSAPVSCSTPMRTADLLRAPHRSQGVSEECSARSTTPSLLTATVGQTVLSRLDDGAGCSTPERVIALWAEEGIRNSQQILQTLDFSMEERLSLADLTLALDNELLASGNGIHQAALISYKDEIQHLQVVAEQACRERDKVKADLDLADHRNLQLVREVDDRHASMENLNQSRIRDLEQDFRDRLMALRSQSEQESEVLLQQVERERGTLQEELQLLRAQEVRLQQELSGAALENCRLEEELGAVKLQLTEAECSVNRLRRDLNQLLHDKFGGLDPAGSGLSHEERFSIIIKEYEQQCRELRDRNDELSSELEVLKGHRSDRKSRRSTGVTSTAGASLNWTDQRSASTESDSEELDMKRNSSSQAKKKLQPADKTALCSLDDVPGPAVSIQTELALEQLKQKHNQELQELRIQLETQVNYYERSQELMRQGMEVERKDISQAFKLEISELEEQKEEAEQQAKQLKEMLNKLQNQQGGGGGWNSEQERRMQRERAELEQNFAREIGNLVQKLSSEKDQLEAELKLKADQEVMLVREEAEQQLSHMKQQSAESQRRLIHRLHRLQEQRGLSEKQLAQSEKEKLHWVEEYDKISSEKKKMEEQHHEDVSRLQLQISQSEASVEDLRERCAHMEDDLEASRGRCSELEARLTEACTQLEESIPFLESQDLLNKRLEEEKTCMEEELQLLRTKEEHFLLQVSQLKAELEDVQAASQSLLQDQEVEADNHSRLSDAFTLQQAQLQTREHSITFLRAELEALQEGTRSKAAELDLLKKDRDKLIQDLKDQAMAVDTLQLELDGVSGELNQRRNAEEALQKALKEEQTRTSQLQASLDEVKEEVCCLSQENGTYTRLVDQLSTQIVEMEDEISTLRDHLKEVSSQLNETADLVLDLRRQLNIKTREVERLRTSSEQLHRDSQKLNSQLEEKDGELDRAKHQLLQLQEVLQDSQNELKKAEELFEQEKKRLTRQLMELETLVLALEEVMDPASPHRTQLEEVRSENGALQERLSVLQQEVHNLEDDVAKRRRKLEDMERDHERSREEEEILRKENSRYREEVLDLSNRNLQLSNDNAELSARLRGDQESVRMLQERLAVVSKEQEEKGAEVRRQQAAWTQERLLLERELSSHKEKVEKLQQSLLSLELEAELLRSKLLAVNQEQLGHTQEVTVLQRNHQEAENKVEELENSVKKLMREKEELHRALEEQEEQTSVTLQDESHKLQVQNQKLHQKLSELQVQSLEVQKLTQEQQSLKSKLKELETARTQAEEQAVRADTALGLVRAQHVRKLQQLQEKADDGCREQVEELQAQLVEEQRRSQQLEETLRLQVQQSSSQISMKQGQYEKEMDALQQRIEELEAKLKGVRMVLQEKVLQLKEQLAKATKSSSLLKDLYVENSQLMKALQVTEQRQKKAERQNFMLEEKINALNRLLKDVVHVSLAT